MKKRYMDIPEPFRGFLVQGGGRAVFAQSAQSDSYFSDLMFLAAVLAMCDA